MLQYRDMRRTGARCPHPRGRGALRLELEGVEGARALEDFLPFWKGEVCAFFCRSRRRGCAGNKPPMRKGRLGGNDASSLPRGARICCRCAGSTLFAPAGQKRFRVGAPDFGRVAGQSWMKKRFAHQERSGRRARKTKHTVLRSMRPPRPRNHPAGRTAGSARTRSRDQSLENPFLGTARPQRRRRQAPARGPAAVYSLHRPNRNVSQRPSPLLVGLGRVYFEPKATGCRPRRPAPRRGRVGLGRGRSLGRE